MTQMKKEHMLNYLESQLEKKLGDYDFAIDWDTKNHTVEVIIILFAKNQENQQIIDSDGIESEEEVVEFEDSILFFNPEKSKNIDENNYLATLPYEGKKGLSKGYIQAFTSYLLEVLTEGHSNLLDFLEGDEDGLFELVWNQETFDGELAKVELAKDFVPYPKY